MRLPFEALWHIAMVLFLASGMLLLRRVARALEDQNVISRQTRAAIDKLAQ